MDENFLSSASELLKGNFFPNMPNHLFRGFTTAAKLVKVSLQGALKKTQFVKGDGPITKLKILRGVDKSLKSSAAVVKPRNKRSAPMVGVEA